MRISRWGTSALAAVVLAASVAAPAVAEEELQPLPPVRTPGGANGSASLGSSGNGSSNVCSQLNSQLAEVKSEWDKAVAAQDYDLANLIRLDYTNIAVSFYQCSLAKGSLI
ncbi:hypothetical protein [Corynebacterium urogenitale]